MKIKIPFAALANDIFDISFQIFWWQPVLKMMYSEKTTKMFQNFLVDLSFTTVNNKIPDRFCQIFVALSELMNFK